MPPFIHIHSEIIPFLETTAKVQVRSTEDKPDALDSFRQTNIPTELYVTIKIKTTRCIYQLTDQTTLKHAPPHTNLYCTLCETPNVDGIICEVWFSSSKKNTTRFICTSCAEKLLEMRDQAIKQTPNSIIASHNL